MLSTRYELFTYNVNIFRWRTEVLGEKTCSSSALPRETGGQSSTVTGFFSQYFSYPLSVSFHQCFVLNHEYTRLSNWKDKWTKPGNLAKKHCSLENPEALDKKINFAYFFHSRDVNFAFTRGSPTRGTSMPSFTDAGKIFPCSPKISGRICPGGRGGECQLHGSLRARDFSSHPSPLLPVSLSHTHTHTHTQRETAISFSANTYTNINRTKNVKSRSVLLYNCVDVVSFVLARNLMEESDTLPVKPGLSVTDKFASRLRI
jgi:hypothetical protein